MTARSFDVEAVPLSGTQLVEASAGTGKTYAISTLVVRLLLETDYDVGRILVVTFTEAATKELKERIRRRAKDALAIALLPPADRPNTDLGRLVGRHHAAKAKERLSRALREFDNAAIHTIHGFCQRALAENSFASGIAFDSELVRDSRPLVEEIVLDFWANEVGNASKIFVEHLRDEGIDPERLCDLSNRVSQTPLMELAPEGLRERAERTRQESGRSFGAMDSSALTASLHRAREAFERDAIEELLSSGTLHGGRYPKKSIPKWCNELEAMFDAGRILPRLPKQFAKFCTPTLQAASKAGGPPEHPFFSACDDLAQQVAAMQQALTEDRRLFYATLIHRVQNEFRKLKRERGVLTFDDLLYGLYAALKGALGAELARGLRERYPVALIDEFQDTDPLQYAIFERAYVGYSNPLFLIGDPKQAIYSFRGADVFAYFHAARSVEERRRFTMETNYRSDEALVDAINTLFASARSPFFFQELSYHRVRARDDAGSAPQFPPKLGTAPVQLRFIQRPDSGREGTQGGGRDSYQFNKAFRSQTLPDWVAGEVARTLDADVVIDGRPLTPRDVAILTRTNAQAFDCQRALQRLRIPSVVLGDRSVFQYSEARELQLFLAAALEPQNTLALRAALTTEMLGRTVGDLLRIENSEEEWELWSERFLHYNQRWRSDGFVQMIRLALKECDIAERLLQLVDGERRMTNLLHLIELLHVEATTNHLGPSGLLHHLAEQRSRIYDQKDSEQIRLESDEDTVTLTTIHKAKGLEYSVVICPYLFGDFLVMQAERSTPRFHDSERGHVLTLDVGSDDNERHLAQMEDEALAENLRLLYVALTRAKHRLIVFWGALPGFEESALGYLLHSASAQSLLGEPNREQVAAAVKALDDDSLLGRLRELAQDSTIDVTVVDPTTTARGYEPGTDTEIELTERKLDGRLALWQRTASFTELAHHGLGTRLGATEGRDHDEHLEQPALGDSDDSRCRLAEFPGGARSGNFFHSVLEECDFTKPPKRDAIEKQLAAHGVGGDDLAAMARSALWDVLRTPLAHDLSLSRVGQHARLNELEFHLPLNAQATFMPGADGSAPLSGRSLAAAFHSHPSAELPEDYPDEVGRLPFLPVRGFLKGYIDLVFEYSGKWYLVDYKSNNLGENYRDYSDAAISRCMAESHYFLQYHLYAVALDRFLAHRKADYVYERDFGGVYYLFLRGMRPTSKGSVFFEKPPGSRIAALASLFDAVSPKTGGA